MSTKNRPLFKQNFTQDQDSTTPTTDLEKPVGDANVSPLPPLEFDGRTLEGDMQFTADTIQKTDADATNASDSTPTLRFDPLAQALAQCVQVKQYISNLWHQVAQIEQQVARGANFTGDTSQPASVHPAASLDKGLAPSESLRHCLPITLNAQSNILVTELLGCSAPQAMTTTPLHATEPNQVCPLTKQAVISASQSQNEVVFPTVEGSQSQPSQDVIDGGAPKNVSSIVAPNDDLPPYDVGPNSLATPDVTCISEQNNTSRIATDDQSGTGIPQEIASPHPATGASQPQLGSIGASQQQLGSIGASQPLLGSTDASQPQLGSIGASQQQLTPAAKALRLAIAASQQQLCPVATVLMQALNNQSQNSQSQSPKTTGRCKLACFSAQLNANNAAWLQGSSIQQALKSNPNMSNEELANLVYQLIYQHNQAIQSFYFVIHNKDKAAPHFHAFLEFEEQYLGCSIGELSQILGIAERNFQKATQGRYSKDNLLAYLIHDKEPQISNVAFGANNQQATTAEDVCNTSPYQFKASYDPSDVITVVGEPFNCIYQSRHDRWVKARRKIWRKHLANQDKQRSKTYQDDLSLLCDLIRHGYLDDKVFASSLNYWYQLHSVYPTQAQAAKDSFDELYQNLISQAASQNLLTKCNLFVHGPSGSGKTSFARKVQKRTTEEADKRGVIWNGGPILGGKHTSDHVGGRSITVLDEINYADPNKVKDLFKILDPNVIESLNAARYKDRKNSQLWTVWCSLNTIEYELSIVNFTEDKEQFLRRFHYDVEIHQDHTVTIRPICKVDGKSKPVFNEEWPDECLPMDAAIDKLINAYLREATHLGLSKYDPHLVKGLNGKQDIYLGIPDENGNQLYHDIDYSLKKGMVISDLVREIARLTQGFPYAGVTDSYVESLKNQLRSVLYSRCHPFLKAS